MAKRRQRSPESLEDLCFKRVCQDIVRHVLNNEQKSCDGYEDDPSYYSKFQMLFGDRLLEEWLRRGRNEINIVRRTEIAYLDYVKFIFNRFVTEIILDEKTDFTEETTSIIAKNCSTSLLCLQLVKRDLTSAFGIMFLKSMKNLTVLGLNWCSFDSVQIMEVISNYLVHLRHLSLQGTTVEDKDIFLLCGHTWPLHNSISECSLTKECQAYCKLQLLQIGLVQTNVSLTGLACLLTHVPTLRKILLVNIPSIAEIIHQISEYRRERGISGIRLHLEDCVLVSDSKILKSLIEACPNLRRLDLKINSLQSTAIGKVLEVSELGTFDVLVVLCENFEQISCKNFKNFWARKGPHLRKLKFIVEEFHGREQGYLQFILGCCPNLSCLRLDLAIIHNDGTVLGDFPYLPLLEGLGLGLCDETEFINTFASKMILTAPNIKELSLNFTIDDKIIFPVLSNHRLKRLKHVFISRNSEEKTDKIEKFLYSLKRDIQVVSPYSL